MSERGVRRSVVLGVVGWITALAALVVVIESRRHAAVPLAASPPANQRGVSTPAAESEPSVAKRSRPAATDESIPYIENLVWGDIDLREAQAVMPDNLYWELGAPTNDSAVLEAREEEKKRRNEEYGLVLSGDANEAQVNAYYDYREQISTDFLELSEWMRHRYDGKMSDEMEGMLDLSIKLHKARLAQIPADRAEAIQRSHEREKIREDWRREQAEFNPPVE